MADLRDKDDERKTDFLPVEFLGRFYDNYETYQIMSEVFYKHIPKANRTLALSDVAQRIQFEIKDTKGE